MESDRKSGREVRVGAMSDVIPELADLSLELEDLTWSETIKFGVQLGMKFPVLRNIGDTQPVDVRLLAAMDSWLRSDPKASWKKVVRALRAIRKKVLAHYPYARLKPFLRSTRTHASAFSTLLSPS